MTGRIFGSTLVLEVITTKLTLNQAKHVLPGMVSISNRVVLIPAPGDDVITTA